MDNSLPTLTGQALAATDSDFNAYSQGLLAVDQRYLDGSQFDLQFFIRRCQHSAQTIAQHYLYLGRDLLVIKERSSREEFAASLEQIGITPRSAWRFMQVAVKFNKPVLEQLATRLAVTKLIELANEDDEDLVQTLDGGTVSGLSLDAIELMSSRELRQALRNAKADATAQQEVLQQKNSHADELAKKLAIAERRPQVERWPAQVAAYQEELDKFGRDAELLLDGVLEIVLNGEPGLDMPIGAQASIAQASVARVNRLTALVAQLQSSVYSQYAQFIDQPDYALAAPLTLSRREES
jgi:hypothetical protein